MEIMVGKWLSKILRSGNKDSALSGVGGIQTGYIKCLGCDTLFEKRANKRWCSSKCYSRTKRLKRRKIREPRKCTECGELFTPIRDNNVRCSKRCQSIWQKRYFQEKCEYYRENRKKHRKPILCRNCQKDFIPSNTLKKYCSDKCRILSRSNKGKTKPIKLMWGVPKLREVDERDIKTSAYADEIRAYKESGKKIITLPSLENPSSPDVIIDGDDSEYIEKDSILIQNYLGEKNG